MRGLAPPLGGISLDEFMRRHWQRRPLLIRAAFERFRSPLSPQRLFALASRDGTECRLITAFGKRWSLRHGPFDLAELPSTERARWTLLVQGVDTLDDRVHALLARFRFVADARLDDLMVSFATDGGGVGPHLDSYDVFLIQAHGRRRWRVAPPGDDTLVPGLPLKILARFQPDREWVLDPGDMLYLPPGWAHEGTAVGECMTFSVGFRAPSRHELLRSFLADACDTAMAGPDPRYRDEGAVATRHPGRIPEPMHTALAGWLHDWRPSRAQVDDFIGRFLTEPKASVWFEAPRRRLAADAFARLLAARGLAADRRTRMSYRGARFFINGEGFGIARGCAGTLRALADRHGLPPGAFDGAPVDPDLLCLLREWFDAGWMRFGPAGATRARRPGPQR